MCELRSFFIFAQQKPLLYFLHGVGCSADLWSALLRHFTAAGYDVVAPDMLGHGYSAAPDNASAYTFQRLLKDSIDIFDRFVGEHRKCVVIGHAYG
jgi:abhydrolase domain-containing protein 8